MQGDCIQRLQDIPDGSIDMVLADPPYGTTKCKWDAALPWGFLWGELRRVAKSNAVIAMTSMQPHTTILISSNLKGFKYCWVWLKPNGTDPFNAPHRPMNNIEDIVVFCHGARSTYHPQMRPGKPYRTTRKAMNLEHCDYDMRGKETINVDGKRYPTRVLEFKQERGLHPAQKPVSLFQYLIRTYTNPGETVLDFAMGSGTTGVAALREKRRFVGIELVNKYYELSEERISQVS